MKFLYIMTLLVYSLNAKELILSMGEDSVIQEISKTILMKAYKDIGQKPKFLTASFSEALELANLGKTDGEVSRIKKITQKFPNLVEVPVSINYIEAVAFSKNISIKIETWKDLAPYKIAVVKGIKFIENPTKPYNRTVVLNYEEAFALLEKKQVDIIVVPKLVGLHKRYISKYHKVKIVSPSLTKVDLYHFLHKKNVDMISKIVPILQEMKDSGELQYLRDAYLRRITQ